LCGGSLIKVKSVATEAFDFGRSSGQRRLDAAPGDLHFSSSALVFEAAKAVSGAKALSSSSGIIPGT
jgi:hypothetical protein